MWGEIATHWQQPDSECLLYLAKSHHCAIFLFFLLCFCSFFYHLALLHHATPMYSKGVMVQSSNTQQSLSNPHHNSRIASQMITDKTLIYCWGPSRWKQQILRCTSCCRKWIPWSRIERIGPSLKSEDEWASKPLFCQPNWSPHEKQCTGQLWWQSAACQWKGSGKQRI